MAEAAFSGQNRVVVDWDGTCVPSAWPEQPQEWLPGAVGALLSFLAVGLDVEVFSTRLAPREVDEQTPRSRTGKLREYRYIRKMLDTAGLERVGIWRKPWKPGGKVYIDDKAVRYEGNWNEIATTIVREVSA